MKFIIFDLDDTLLCGDCEAGWINFLVIKGLLDGDEHSSKLNQFDIDYRKGILNFNEYSSYIQTPLKNLDISTVENLVDEFIKKNIDDLTDDQVTLLRNSDILTINDIADLSIDELLDIIDISNETAGKVIMQARESWFDEENDGQR